MHSSDTAQHTSGVLCPNGRKNKQTAVYVLINLTAKKTWTVAICSTVTVTGLKSIGIVKAMYIYFSNMFNYAILCNIAFI